ncbi:MAG: hypothetical protein NC191_09210 [Muribaculaceae bacterium]|nr:hypothetical protein [Muribaculaceae bacterium]
MKKTILLMLMFIPLTVFADMSVPEFNKMKTLRCDFEETIYNEDNSIVSRSKLFRVYKLDDENLKIYLQKEPIDNVLYYGGDRVEFVLQSMTDDVIIMSRVNINRQNGEYFSNSQITYDNEMFGTRTSKSAGVCKFID